MTTGFCFENEAEIFLDAADATVASESTASASASASVTLNAIAGSTLASPMSSSTATATAVPLSSSLYFSAVTNSSACVVPTAAVLHAAPLFPDAEDQDEGETNDASLSLATPAATEQDDEQEEEERRTQAAGAARGSQPIRRASISSTQQQQQQQQQQQRAESLSAFRMTASSGHYAASAAPHPPSRMTNAASALLAHVGGPTGRALLPRRSPCDAVARSLMRRRYDENGRTIRSVGRAVGTRPSPRYSWSLSSSSSSCAASGQTAASGGVSSSASVDTCRRSNVASSSSMEHEELFDPTRFCTVVTGMGGIGKTTLAAMVVSRPDILSHFYDGIAWVSLGQTKIVDSTYDSTTQAVCYGRYCDKIRSICEQLNLNPPHFESPSFSIDEEDSAKKSKVERLMNDARQDTINLLFGLTSLIVLDDLWNPSDAAWFYFGNTPASSLRVLITTRARSSRATGLGVPDENAVHLAELDEREAARLFAREARASARESGSGARAGVGVGVGVLGDAEQRRIVQAAEAVKACRRHPVVVRSAARLLGSAATSDDAAERILATLRSPVADVERQVVSPHPYSSLFQFLARSFSDDLHGPVLARVLKVSFVAVSLVFKRTDCARPFVPANSIKLLFESIIVDDERASISGNPMNSCAGIILDLMDRLGLMETMKSKSRPNDIRCVSLPSKTRIVNYRIHHDLMLRYAFHLLHTEESLQESNIADRLRACRRGRPCCFADLRKHVSQYAKKRKQKTRQMKEEFLLEQFSILLIQRLLGDKNGKCKIHSVSSSDTDGYAFRFLPHHMLLVGGKEMRKNALRLLRDEGFIRGRMFVMGFVNGVKSHEADLKSIMKQISIKEKRMMTKKLDSTNACYDVYQAVIKFLATEESCASSARFSEANSEDIRLARSEIESLLQNL